MTGPKSDMSSRIKNAHIDLIQEFLVELSKRGNQIESDVLEDVDEEHRDHWVGFFSR